MQRVEGKSNTNCLVAFIRKDPKERFFWEVLRAIFLGADIIISPEQGIQHRLAVFTHDYKLYILREIVDALAQGETSNFRVVGDYYVFDYFDDIVANIYNWTE